MHINLRQLRHFMALVEHRSFAAAATQVNLSQSAFSRSIQMLEASAGGALVDRSAKNLPLTPKGHLVFRRARRLLQEASLLSQEVASGEEQPQEMLRLACGPAAGAYVVPKALAKLIGQVPGVRVDFDMVQTPREGMLQLKAQEVEFLVIDSRAFEGDPAYNVVRLRQRQWGFCCRVGHPLARKPVVTAVELLDYPLVGTFRSPGVAKGLALLTGRPDFRPAVMSKGAYGLKDLVQDSNAIGVAIDCDPEVVSGALKLLPVQELWQREELRTHYGFVSLADQPLSPVAQRYLELLREADRIDSVASNFASAGLTS